MPTIISDKKRVVNTLKKAQLIMKLAEYLCYGIIAVGTFFAVQFSNGNFTTVAIILALCYPLGWIIGKIQKALKF